MNRLSITIGIGLVIIGVLFILGNMNVLDISRVIIPVILTFAGIVFVLNPSIFRIAKQWQLNNFPISRHAVTAKWESYLITDPKDTTGDGQSLSSGLRSFKTLFVYAKGIEILGWVILSGSLLLGILIMVEKIQIELLFLVSSVGGFIIGISMILTAQSILVILQIENNTRQNAKHFEAIRDLLQKSIAQS